ncbi:hypothetical protein RSOLAG22IIIB_06274 [Rhizoctonia solani]|uniref:Arrestin-like N-terminal domain-containing protein n=1 Tax=Rhizoctonia solani TaxID=456999 RepID=A0A0K6GCY1_9AGAM|nr:hypothetical protein RSOLAG22IIIB_06274 [Rhizoctonia solani]
MDTFDSLLGSLRIEVELTHYNPYSFSADPTKCHYRGTLLLQAQDLLGTTSPKLAWEGLGYKARIEQFSLTVASPVHRLKLWHADEMGRIPVPRDVAAYATDGARYITFFPRKWTHHGELAVEFEITIPYILYPPYGRNYQFELTASATVTVVNKELNQEPVVMRRTAPAVSFELMTDDGWPI